MKKYMMIIATIALALLSMSCDEINGNYVENSPITVDTSKVVQKFLLEDYTGYQCGNCPKAHEEAHKILELYPHQVIVLGVHAGSFAEPYAAHPYDFRTPIGTIYDEFFGNSEAGNPNGMINRMKFNDSYIVRHTKWASAITEMINDEPTLGIKLEPSYSDIDRKITVKVDMNYLKNSTQSDYLCVLISENNIIQYQKDYSNKENPDSLHYNHEHVLRGGITSAWGEQVSAAPISANQKFTKTLTFTIPNNDWKIEDLNIVAYVYSKEKSYQILQAESKKLK